MNYEFSYLSPKSQDDLLKILNDQQGKVRLLAGGTDLLVNIRVGVLKPSVVVDIKKVPGHDTIAYSDAEGLSIGAAVTISQLMEHPIIQKKFPALVAAAHVLASHQLRNRATVIGNLCNASPCADMAPPLLCLGARVRLASLRGRREMALQDFFTGVKKTQIRPDEYAEKILVPPTMAGAGGGFKKLKRVRGHDIGVVSVGMTKKKGKVRIAVGSAAPTPIYVGEFPASTPLKKLQQAAVKAIKPIDDVRGSADYRIFMVQTYIQRLMKEVRG